MAGSFKTGMSMNKAKAAFFDIDGTLIKGLIICAFPEYLAPRRLFDIKANNKIQSILHSYTCGEKSYREIAIQIPREYALGIRGQKQADISVAASNFIQDYTRNIFTYAKHLVVLMNHRNFLTIAISGSPIEAAKKLKFLGFTEIFGTEMSLRNGVYDGKVKTNLIISEEKSRLFDRLTRNNNIDLEASFGFGDTEQDIPILERVGNPIPLNPNPLLLEHALKQNWVIPNTEHLVADLTNLLNSS